MSPQLSVVIPTYKRAAILQRCLEFLAKQTIADRMEVIVVSDGHDPETAALFSQGSKLQTSSFPLQFIEIPKSQQGVARNRGVAIASSPTCLFIGDDIFLDPDCCALHESIHRNFERPVAVLGTTGWDPTMEITEVMEWLMKSGWQFGYPKIEQYAGTLLPQEIQHLFSYTSNLSVPTDIVRRLPFLENVSLYGWEDIEWGTRLRDTGIGIYYEPHAHAVHHHRITLEDSLNRLETLGESVVHMEKIAPGFDRRPHGLKRIAYELLALFPTMSGKHRAAFLRGMKKASASAKPL